jgi:hypothetical protein
MIKRGNMGLVLFLFICLLMFCLGYIQGWINKEDYRQLDRDAIERKRQ